MYTCVHEEARSMIFPNSERQLAADYYIRANLDKILRLGTGAHLWQKISSEFSQMKIQNTKTHKEKLADYICRNLDKNLTAVSAQGHTCGKI